MMGEIFDKYDIVDNVNKSEEQGSNTKIITPEYLLRDAPRSEIIETKQGIPPPNQRRQVNELMNDQVETVPDVINVNQNQTGINESTTRQRQQDITSQESQLGFQNEQDKKRWEESRRIMNEKIEQMKREIDGPLQADLAGLKNRNNPPTASSMRDNSNYQNTTEDKRNTMIEYAQELQLPDADIQEISEMGKLMVDEVYKDYLNTIKPRSDEGDYSDYESIDDDEFEQAYIDLFGQVQRTRTSTITRRTTSRTYKNSQG